VVINKAAKGKKDTIIAIIAGTDAIGIKKMH